MRQRLPLLSAFLLCVLPYSSSVPLSALTCLCAPLTSLFLTCLPPLYTNPHTIGPTSQTTREPFKRQPLIQKGLGVKLGEENYAGLGKGEGRGWGAGFSFPLNCPTWLSVLSLNKHSHFLLTAHIGTHTQAGTHPHKHTPIWCTGMVELHYTKTSMCTHTHNTPYTLAGCEQYFSLAL